jgi:hypothetical protein
MSDTQALVRQIQRAFVDVEYPGDHDLTSSTYGEEPAALVEAFRGRADWSALDPEFLDQAPDGWASALSFFSARALRFYLPAYLIADLRGELSHSDPAYRLCIAVTPLAGRRRIARRWGGGTLGEIARAEFELLDPGQVRAVVAYLWWRLERFGPDLTIEQALESYWLEREQRLTR